jgi:hypothetical protein
MFGDGRLRVPSTSSLMDVPGALFWPAKLRRESSSSSVPIDLRLMARQRKSRRARSRPGNPYCRTWVPCSSANYHALRGLRPRVTARECTMTRLSDRHCACSAAARGCRYKRYGMTGTSIATPVSKIATWRNLTTSRIDKYRITRCV